MSCQPWSRAPPPGTCRPCSQFAGLESGLEADPQAMRYPVPIPRKSKNAFRLTARHGLDQPQGQTLLHIITRLAHPMPLLLNQSSARARLEPLNLCCVLLISGTQFQPLLLPFSCASFLEGLARKLPSPRGNARPQPCSNRRLLLLGPLVLTSPFPVE